jgi:uncharacterized damage-inducible protein DinB
MKTRFALLALAIPAVLSAQAPQMHPGGPMTNAFAARYANFYRLLPQAFDSIPADKFSYKPTPAQQTIGYVAQHLANDNYFFCNNFSDKKATRPEEETATHDTVKATWPKEKLVMQLKASIAFCQEALAGVTDASLSGTVQQTFRGQTREVPRMNAFVGHAIDMADHYSQIANYMRLNGMLPPSALPRPNRPSGN